MVRVTRRGGRIIMGNWIPDDPTLVAQILKISSAYTPPPPEGFVSPMTWGLEEKVNERFVAAGVPADAGLLCAQDLHLQRARHTVVVPGRVQDHYGPTMNAFEAAEKNGRAADLQRELEELFNSQNTSQRADRTIDPGNFPAGDTEDLKAERSTASLRNRCVFAVVDAGHGAGARRLRTGWRASLGNDGLQLCRRRTHRARPIAGLLLS